MTEYEVPPRTPIPFGGGASAAQPPSWRLRPRRHPHNRSLSPWLSEARRDRVTSQHQVLRRCPLSVVGRPAVRSLAPA